MGFISIISMVRQDSRTRKRLERLDGKSCTFCGESRIKALTEVYVVEDGIPDNEIHCHNCTSTYQRRKYERRSLHKSQRIRRGKYQALKDGCKFCGLRILKCTIIRRDESGDMFSICKNCDKCLTPRKYDDLL